jgi:tetratricopeptide (TPR) repeat protein
MSKSKIPKFVFIGLALITCDLQLTTACADSGGFEHAEKLFLEGRYERAANEAGRLIDAKAARRDELYYLKGLSELKSRRYKDARSSFEELLSRYPESALALDAHVGIGDSYLLEDDNGKAHKVYSEVLEKFPQSKNISWVYYKLGVCYKKMGSDDRARQYFGKVKDYSPGSFEARMIPEIATPSSIAKEKEQAAPVRTNFLPAKSNISPRSGIKESIPEAARSATGGTRKTFSVQTGSFNSRRNAEKLMQRLSRQGYEARVEIPTGGADRMYRVKVGRFDSRAEAEAEAAKLKKLRYGTKICER